MNRKKLIALLLALLCLVGAFSLGSAANGQSEAHIAVLPGQISPPGLNAYDYQADINAVVDKPYEGADLVYLHVGQIGRDYLQKFDDEFLADYDPLLVNRYIVPGHRVSYTMSVENRTSLYYGAADLEFHSGELTGMTRTKCRACMGEDEAQLLAMGYDEWITLHLDYFFAGSDITDPDVTDLTEEQLHYMFGGDHRVNNDYLGPEDDPDIIALAKAHLLNQVIFTFTRPGHIAAYTWTQLEAMDDDLRAELLDYFDDLDNLDQTLTMRHEFKGTYIGNAYGNSAQGGLTAEAGIQFGFTLVLEADGDTEPTPPPTGQPPVVTEDPDPTPSLAGDVVTVTYHLNDGSEDDIYDSEQLTVGDTATEPVPPEREGYLFEGWFPDPDTEADDIPYDFATPVEENLDLYAAWSEEPDIQFDDNHFAYMVGYPDGEIKPENPITRAEVATIFFRIVTDETRESFWSTSNHFPDVQSDDWYNNAVSTVYRMGLVQGYPSGEFEPNSDITRAELAALVARYEGGAYSGPDLFDDIDGHWAQQEINLAASLGWVEGDGDGNYRPEDAITRAEVAAMVNRVTGRNPEHIEDLLEEMITWPDNRNIAEWYYLDIQEASNSHHYERKTDREHETWLSLRESPDWTLLERPDSTPQSLYP